MASITTTATSSRSFIRRLLILLAILVTGAYGWYLLAPPELGAQEDRATAESAAVMARVNGVDVTIDQVAKTAGGKLIDLERQRHELLAKATRGTVWELLIEAEASKRGVSKDELVKVEVTDKIAAITDADIDTFYEEFKARIRQPKEQATPQIRGILGQTNSQKAYQTFVASLEAASEVDYFDSPFRVEVEALGPRKGSADAPVTVIEFSDFECPFCSQVLPTMAQIEAEYGDKVSLVFRQNPLPNHRNARKAAEASLCANEQGKFWQLHDSMFADQKNLSLDGLRTKAAAAELDMAEFNSCLDSSRFAATVQRDIDEGAMAGVSGTPAYFINGRFLNGALPFDQFKTIIDEELANSGS